MSRIEEQNKVIADINEKYILLENSIEKEKNILKNSFEKEKNNLKNEIEKLKLNVSELNDIHETIYFRDVSKFYILEFANVYGVKGYNTYDICLKILKFNFSKKGVKDLKEVIIKIVTKYLNGNKLSHMEFFISKRKANFKKLELVKEIEDSYATFMKFSAKEKNLLNSNFRLENADFIYFH